MPISIKCPKCAAKLKAIDSIIGTEVPCPRCGHLVLCTDPIANRPQSELASVDSADNFEALPSIDDPAASLEPLPVLDERDVVDPAFVDLGDIDLGEVAAAAPIIPNAFKPLAVSQPPSEPDEEAPRKLTTPLILAIAGTAALFLISTLAMGAWFLFHKDAPTLASNTNATSVSQTAEPGSTGVDVPANSAAASSDATTSNDLVAAASTAAVSAAAKDGQTQNAKTTTTPESHAPLDLTKDSAQTGTDGSIERTANPSDAASGIKNTSAEKSTPPSPQAPSKGDSDPLDKLMAATVFIKITTSTGQQSGSGFLVMRDGNEGVVLTNSHVVEPASGSLRKIACTFHSGRREEYTVTGELLGDDELVDLAVISVKHDSLPEPLEPAADLRLRETLPVLILGFPFGDALKTSKRNPSITVSKGTISSIRRDDNDDVAILQIDGGINPGNSGGPILTEDGKLVGTAVAKVQGADIGFAIPERLSTELMRGQVSRFRLRLTSKSSDGLSYEMKMQLVDPRKNLKSISLLTCQAKDVTVNKPESDGKWKKASEKMVETEATFSQKEGTATFKTPADRSKWVLQVSWTRNDGSQRFSKVIDIPRENDPRSQLASIPRKSPLESEPRREASPQISKPSETVADIRVTPIPANAATLINHLVWSEDGSHVFTLSKSGVLQKFSLEEFTEAQSVDLGGRCSFLGRSKEGLVVVLDSLQQICSIDERTLKVKKQIKLAGVSRIACAPATSTIYAAQERAIVAVDLRTTKSRILHPDLPPAADKSRRMPMMDFKFLTLTPDGKYLFAESGIEMLVRIRVRGDSFIVEENSPRIGSNAQEIIVSDDSKFVAMPSGGGNSKAEGHPEMNYGTYIYAVGDLQSPHLGIETGAYPQMLAFDQKAKKIYAQNHDCQLIVFNHGGVHEGAYRWDRGDVKRMIAHPKGNSLCLLTETRLMYVELLKDLPSQEEGDKSAEDNKDAEMADEKKDTETAESKSAVQAAKDSKSEFRTWSDASGKFKVSAKFISADNDNVTVQREDGKQVTVPISRLCDEDRQFIEEQKQSK